jgi:hypothetical protein
MGAVARRGKEEVEVTCRCGGIPIGDCCLGQCASAMASTGTRTVTAPCLHPMAYKGLEMMGAGPKSR